MRFVSIRELRNQPGAVWAKLGREDMVLTSNGKPVGVLVGVEEDDLELTLDTLRQCRASLAVSRMRKMAAETGTHKMSRQEIEREIRAVRSRRQGS